MTPGKLVVAILSITSLLEVRKNEISSRYELSGGVEGMFLKDVLKGMEMEYELVLPKDGKGGPPTQNGSWTGLIGMVQRGEADLACPQLTMTEERKEAVDFSAMYGLSHYTFAIRKAKPERLKNAFLHPFKIDVWGYFAVMFLVMTISFWIVNEGHFSIGQISFEVFGSILKQPFVVTSGDSLKVKFLLALCCVYAVVMTSSYSGVLLSFLTVPIEGNTVENFRQLSEAVAKGTHKCYVFQNTMMVDQMKGDKEEYLQTFGNEIAENSWYLKEDDAWRFVLSQKPNEAIFTNFNLLELVYKATNERRANFLISSDTFGVKIVGMAVNRNFCCREKLDKVLQRLTEAGLLKKYLSDEYFRRKVKVKSNDTQTDEDGAGVTISVESITEVLYILVSGYTVSFVVFFSRNMCI